MSSDLFDAGVEKLRFSRAPLADRMRPRTIDEYVGQKHILGPGRLLRRSIEADRITSLILYGPPGTGKTTLARIIAGSTRSHFVTMNAVLAGVKDIRLAIQDAEDHLKHHQQRTILFIDEVHRFNKSQQDALLPHVENGTVTLIGATTENPYFEVIKALVSRSRIFELRSLTEEDLEEVVIAALSDAERGYGKRGVSINPDALAHLVSTSNGDARSLLNALELAVETTNDSVITREVAEESIQKRAILYDKEGDAHFDTISAFIKSLRGSDPDASMYWMGRMLYAGEDPKFILRRMLIFAAEDIGMADPRAVQMAVSCAQAFEYIGLPEGRFHLAECCLYLATAPKSNSTSSFFQALKFVEEEQTGDIPNHLKDGSRDAKGLGHGEGYKFPHSFRNHYVPQQYLPDEMQGTYFYHPSDVGYERTIQERLNYWRSRDEEADLKRRVNRYLDPPPEKTADSE